ncbi:MAG: hypothetical protein CL927_14090 [Deltaproteobacteria bacterium]|nr:hypothetical protein [Deltaproteobacteria bacterium]HCH64105.1 hypothetical protein [Deltaproteobacteria bacterium]
MHAAAIRQSWSSLPPVRVAVVGLGYWGRKLARRYQQLAGAELIGICDHDTHALARSAAVHGAVPAVEHLADLLSLKPDLVVVATEPATHVHVAREALQAGCAVFVEKPVTTTVEDIEELQALAHRAQRPLLGSALWSWDATVDALAQLIADGEIGQVLRIEGARQNLGCLKPGHDVIDDLMPHDLQILRRITGRSPDRLQAWGSRLARTAALDTATVRMEWKDGPEAELRLSWVAPEKVRRMTIVGTEGMAVLAPLDTATPLRVLRATPADAARPEPATVQDIWLPPIASDRTEPLLAQCEETLRCVRGATPRLSIRAHREVAAALEAARRSVAHHGQLVEIDIEDHSDRASRSERRAPGALPEVEANAAARLRAKPAPETGYGACQQESK